MSDWIQLNEEYREALKLYTKTEEQLNFLTDLFERAINFYGYEYMRAPDETRVMRETDKLIEQMTATANYLRTIGEVTTAEDVEWHIERLKAGELSEPTKKSVYKKVRAMMKEALTSAGMSEKKFNDNAAKLLKLYADYLEDYPPSKPYPLNDSRIDPGDIYGADDFNIHD